jgi:hypothetical protein
MQDLGDKASWKMAIWKSKKEIIGYTKKSEERGVTAVERWMELVQIVSNCKRSL